MSKKMCIKITASSRLNWLKTPIRRPNSSFRHVSVKTRTQLDLLTQTVWDVGRVSSHTRSFVFDVTLWLTSWHFNELWMIFSIKKSKWNSKQTLWRQTGVYYKASTLPTVEIQQLSQAFYTRTRNFSLQAFSYRYYSHWSIEAFIVLNLNWFVLGMLLL